MMPNTPLKERITKQWGDIGFQGKDPQTDFRGMGMLELPYPWFIIYLLSTELTFILSKTKIEAMNLKFYELLNTVEPVLSGHPRGMAK